MMWIISFLQKRPSDMTIRVGRIAFGLIFMGIIYYNLIVLNKSVDVTFFDFSFFGYVLSNWVTLGESGTEIFKYALMILGLPPVIMGIVNKCFLKKTQIRIVQVVFAIILFYIASIYQDSPTLDADVIIGLMGVLPLLAGITGKCVTKGCLNYGEKITKIRV